MSLPEQNQKEGKKVVEQPSYYHGTQAPMAKPADDLRAQPQRQNDPLPDYDHIFKDIMRQFGQKQLQTHPQMEQGDNQPQEYQAYDSPFSHESRALTYEQYLALEQERAESHEPVLQLPKYSLDAEFSVLLPELSKDEYRALKSSIEQRGLQNPIILDQDHVVIDGHNRLKACEELGIEPRFEVKAFGSREDRISFLLDTILGRRHLKNDYFRVVAAQPLLRLEREKAGFRMSQGGVGPIGPRVKGRAIEKVARTVGVKPHTFKRIQWLIDHDCQETILKLKEGLITPFKAYKLEREKEESRNTLSKQKGKQGLESGKPAAGLGGSLLCAGCKEPSTRGKTKLIRLCEECRRKFGLDR